MKNTDYRVFVASFTMLILGCTTVPKGDEKHAITSQVKIYEADQFPQGRYRPIKLVWAGSSSIPFWGPEYKTAEEGITALRLEAKRLGANGLTNVGCFQDGTGLSLLHLDFEPVFTCYGEAIQAGSVAR